MCACISHADDDTSAELVHQLLLQAGRLMEDASPAFALALPESAEVLDARIASLDAVASDLHALATAARALFRLGAQTG